MADAGDCEFAKGKDLGAHFKPYIYNVKTAGSGFVSNFRTASSSILRKASLVLLSKKRANNTSGR